MPETRHSRMLVNLLMVSAVVLVCFLSSFAAAGSVLLSSSSPFDRIALGETGLSGLSPEEALSRIQSHIKESLGGLSIPLIADGQEILLTADLLLSCYDIEGTLAALSSARSDSLFDGFQAIFQGIPSQEVVFSVDHLQTMDLLEDLLTPYDVLPTDAQALYHAETDSFSYTQDAPGKKADVLLVANRVQTQIEARDNTRVSVPYASVAPLMTQGDLERNTVQIASRSLALSREQGQNDVLFTAVDRLAGAVLPPGETLSLLPLLTRQDRLSVLSANSGTEDLFGEATLSPLSSLLYQAALTADLEIVERHSNQHTPSAVSMGQDAAVGGENNLDLKIKNNSSYPVTVGIQYKANNRTLTLSLYGQPLPAGRTIELATELLREIPATGERLISSDRVREGRRQLYQAGKAGGEVSVSLRYYDNGSLVKTQPVSSDVYQPREPIYLLGNGKNGK